MFRPKEKDFGAHEEWIALGRLFSHHHLTRLRLRRLKACSNFSDSHGETALSCIALLGTCDGAGFIWQVETNPPEPPISPFIGRVKG